MTPSNSSADGGTTCTHTRTRSVSKGSGVQTCANKRGGGVPYTSGNNGRRRLFACRVVQPHLVAVADLPQTFLDVGRDLGLELVQRVVLVHAENVADAVRVAPELKQHLVRLLPLPPNSNPHHPRGPRQAHVAPTSLFKFVHAHDESHELHGLRALPCEDWWVSGEGGGDGGVWEWGWSSCFTIGTLLHLDVFYSIQHLLSRNSLLTGA